MPHRYAMTAAGATENAPCGGIARTSVSRRGFLKAGCGAALAANAFLAQGCTRPRSGEPPNVLLITLDTTRADRLSCYGYRRETSPNLDKLAAQCVLYKNAVATSNWTLPTHASLFTGKYVTSHGARYDPNGDLILTSAVETPDEWQWKQFRTRKLAAGNVTLAECLKQAGFATGGVVAGPWMKTLFGLNRGFDFYDDNGIANLQGRPGPEVTSSALAWLDEHRPHPFFLFLNYFDPHFPYILPEDFTMKFMGQYFTEAQLKDPVAAQSPEVKNGLYDMEIAYMDKSIGRLLDRMKHWKIYDNTLIVVVADHGELLGEHDFWQHGRYLFEEEIHIPFFVKFPLGEIAANQDDFRIQQVDVLPLILERLDLSVPDGIQGQAPSKIDHPVVAEMYPLDFLSPFGDSQAILDGTIKFVQSTKVGDRLFDLEQPKPEDTNRLDTHAEQAAHMKAALNDYIESLPKPDDSASPAKAIDEETQKALKGLGYL